MTKLTEDMIIARTKSSDLGAVKKLNCWGSDLDDVSLLKRLSNVEVLSLSLNRITALSDFQFCRNLVELYIRRNMIRDLSELCYLQDLPRLRRLLLAENPCVETAGAAYRATVIRCLPSLEVLDNNEVSPEEVDHAMKTGLILEHPQARRERNSPEPAYYREDSPPQHHNRRTSQTASYEYDEDAVVFRTANALSRSPPSESYYAQPEEQRSPVLNGPATNGIASNPLLPISNGSNRRNSVHSSGSVIDDRPSSPTNNNNSDITSARRIQQSPVQEYHQQPRGEFTNGYQQRRGSVDYVQETSRNYQEPVYYDDSPPPPSQRNSVSGPIQSQRITANNVLPARGKPRPKQPNGTRFMEQNPAGPRSSNLLSAVLCLLPELDWASLEVVELAVRRRMDELLSD